jgi:hypothetical protein
MGRPKRQDVREDQVKGLKYVDRLGPLLARLHDVGTARDQAGNRTLFFDQYCFLVLLFLFNPLVSSLRAIQQASQLQKVQRRLGCARASLGSLSEAVDVFEPERLQEIVQELSQELGPIARDARLAEVKQTITLADSTVLAALPRITAAMWRTQRKGEVRHSWALHTEFCLDRSVPERMTLTNGSNSGAAHERAVLKEHLQADRCYVMDRGYFQYTLFNAIRAASSSYVCRVRDTSGFVVTAERPLSEAARQAGVTQDVVGRMGDSCKAAKRPDHLIRLVCLTVKPHVKRCGAKGRAGPPSDGVLRIATDLLDVPAEIIALIYQYRYTIEIFFRFFKHVLGCRHLLSDDPKGIAIQTYCAIIACLLVALYSGRKPTLRTYEMVCYYFLGLADTQEMLAHLARLAPQA